MKKSSTFAAILLLGGLAATGWYFLPISIDPDAAEKYGSFFGKGDSQGTGQRSTAPDINGSGNAESPLSLAPALSVSDAVEPRFVSIDFKACEIRKKWISTRYGGSTYDIVKYANNFCEMHYGGGIEDMIGDGRLNTVCNVPISLGNLRFPVADEGIDFSTIQQYCVKIRNEDRTFTIDFANCQAGEQTVWLSLGSVTYDIKGIKNDLCEMDYGGEVENPEWDRKLTTKCKVPASLGKVKFTKTAYGIGFSPISEYCAPQKKNAFLEFFGIGQ